MKTSPGASSTKPSLKSFNTPEAEKGLLQIKEQQKHVRYKRRLGAPELTGKLLTFPVRRHHHTAPSCQLDR